MVELKEVFTNIYESNLWTSKESRSGLGSELKSTEVIRRELPELFKKFKIESVLDIPCGDFNWMQHVDMSNVNYIGADIVDKMIESNNITFPNIDFRVLDLTESELPKVDLIFVRDLLGHFNYQNVNKALQNIIKSGSKYLLTTSFTRWHYNVDIQNGGWRPINLMLQPFSLKPIYLINEDCFEGDGQYNDKCLLLFEIKRLYCGS
jgi:2-polyprenyl-3-methyl-5-hydroxy-6-metoxy-1,4-benzoquinol methylase